MRPDPKLARAALSLALLAFIAGAVSAQPAPARAAPAEPEPAPPVALVAAFPAEGGHVRAAVLFGLEATGAAGTLEATARLLRRGESAPVDSFRIETPLEDDELEGRQRLQVYGDLVAPPGSYRLELEIRAGEKSARADYPLTLERPPADRPIVLPPFLLDDEGAVAAFYELGDQELGEHEQSSVRQPPSDYPLVAAGERFMPDLAPRLGEDVPRSRVCLLGRGLTGEKTFLETGLVAADGTLLGKERLAMISRDEADASGDGFETLCFGLDTQSLPAGLYQLNVSLHDFERRTVEKTELSFEIVAD